MVRRGVLMMLLGGLLFAFGCGDSGGGGEQDTSGGEDTGAVAECGNGVIETGEQCDGDLLNGETCESRGAGAGTLACTDNCTFDISGCEGQDPCGNGQLDDGEECDGELLNDETCMTQGFIGGTLSCTDACTLDTSDCTPDNTCLNGQLDEGEQCDGELLNGETCETQGFDGGTLGCTDDCTFDTAACTDEPEPCGNGQLDEGEQCDGELLNDETCETQGFDGGTLACADDCTFDTTACTDEPDPCGNGQLDEGEDCDGELLNDETCETQGFDGGTLACADDCTFDTALCTDEPNPCGNEQLDEGEECDGDLLNGETCESQGFGSGTLGCTGCMFDTTGCAPAPECGDGAINGDEQCDGDLLGDATCESLGYDSGTLACADCAFDVTNCVGEDPCGNGQIDGGEDCDGDLLNDQTCETLGYDEGTLGCNDQCQFDESACANVEPCGNGQLDDGEACDGELLNDQTCETLGYDSGALACNDDCTLDTTDCVQAAECGDDMVNGDEDCDGDDLNGMTCELLGYQGGTLGCTDCAFDVSLCEGEPSCEDDDFEQNDTMEQAAAIADGTYPAVMCADVNPDEEDWYAIDVMVGDMLRIDVQFYHLELDLDIHLRNADGDNVATSSSSDDDEQVEYAVETAGTLYLRVYPYGTGVADYTIVVDRTAECFANDDCEPGNICVADACVPGCELDSDCPDGQICEMAIDDTMECVDGCRDDSGCGDGFICEENLCVAGCRYDSDCADGLVCLGNECIVPGCLGNEDCELGEACVDYFCQATTCSVDDDMCGDYGLVCDIDSGVCVECLTAADCPNDVDFLCVENACELSCTDDMYAPNGTVETAAALTLPLDATELALCGEKAEDWFALTLQANHQYEIELLFTDADGDVDAKLYAEGDLETSVVSGTSGTDNETLSFYVGADAAGTYYLQVLLYSEYTQAYTLSVTETFVECLEDGDCAAGDFCIENACVSSNCVTDEDCAPFGDGLVCDVVSGACVECVSDEDCDVMEACEANLCVDSCPEDMYEDNDTQEMAAAIELGTHELAICQMDGADADWFVIDLDANETLLVRIDFVDAIADMDLEIYDADGVEIDSSAGTSDVEDLAHTATVASSVYIKAFVYGTSLTSTVYSMTLISNPGCVEHTDCADTEVCVDYACIEGCRDDDGCDAGFICEDFACVAGCRANDDCLETEVCTSDNVCIEGCRDNAACGDGFVCVDYACIEGCASSSECPEGQICLDYQCQEGCELSDDCPLGSYCGDDYQCVEGCEYNSNCPLGFYCALGECEVGCDGWNSRCPEGELCGDDDLCYVPDCFQNEDCALGEACADNVCVAVGCGADADCADYDMVCDVDAGYCVECLTDDECDQDFACAANYCVLSCVDDAYEENDDKDSASAITLPFYDNALAICEPEGATEEDWYTFDVVAGDQLAIAVLFIDEDADIDIRLETADGTSLGYGGSTSDNEEIQELIEADGTLYLKIYSIGTNSAPYTLDIQLNPECMGDDDCEEGKICEAFECTRGCRADDDCAIGEVCQDMQCIVPGCTDNDDCLLGEACIDFVCTVTDCVEDSECSAYDMVCDPDSGHCVPCVTSDDCIDADAFACVNNVCELDCDEDVFEPNSDAAEAAMVTVPVSEDMLTLCGKNDEDWFSAELLGGHAYRIEVLFIDEDGDIDIAAYHESDLSSSVASGGSTTDNEIIEAPIAAEAGGIYYLKVRLFTSTIYSAVYDLRITDLGEIGCVEDEECLAGQACVDYQCIDVQCDTDSDCAALQICEGRQCVDVECTVDDDCDGLAICTANACVAVDCLVDADCDGMAVCSNNTCTDVECLTDADCVAPEVCSNNVCLELGAGDACASAIPADVFPFSQTSVDISLYNEDIALADSVCTGYGTAGRDVVYQVALMSGETVTATLDASYDASLYITDTCAATIPACLDGSDSFGGAETATYTAGADMTVYVIVDYFMSGPSAGTFDLTIDVQ